MGGQIKTDREYLVIGHNHIKCQKVLILQPRAKVRRFIWSICHQGKSESARFEIKYERLDEFSSERASLAEIETDLSKLIDRRSET